MTRTLIGLFSAAALTLTAATVSAAPPLQVSEVGFDNPATRYSAPRTASGAGAPVFPWTVNETGFDNPGTVYAAPGGATRTAGSPFPWTVNETGPYVAAPDPSAGVPALRTAGR